MPRRRHAYLSDPFVVELSALDAVCAHLQVLANRELSPMPKTFTLACAELNRQCLRLRARLARHAREVQAEEVIRIAIEQRSEELL